MDGEGGIIIEPNHTPGFKFRAGMRQVQVLVEPLPDYRLDMYFVEFGYQADHYQNLKSTGTCDDSVLSKSLTTCRDFGGDHRVPKLIERIREFADKMILEFKKDL